MRNLLVILFISISSLGFAQSGIPDAPNPPRLVNDFTNSTLSQQELRALENKVLGYEDSTSTQVSILIVESLNGYEVVDFAQRTAEKWKVGTAKDNGVFIVVSINDRMAAIVTGYGMEGSITDAATYTIREEYMNPRFKEGNFYKGLDDATNVIFELASGEYTTEQFAQNRRRGNDGGGGGFRFFIVFFFLVFILPAIFGRRRGRGIGTRGIPWWAWLMMGNSMGRRRDDDWDNFRGGGGMFGGGGSGFGGGGGGFGGFGGGSFGGGGSGGSW